MLLTVALVAQAALVYGFQRQEYVPPSAPLSTLPRQLGGWQLLQEGVVEKQVQDVLKADDTLSRFYSRPGDNRPASLFIALFRTQRTGKAPHSPKNCLPGSGWVPSKEGQIAVDLPGHAGPATINRYVVQKGDHSSVVLYWYQARDRVIASEYTAKVYSVLDALRLNRTDTSLVRVVVPVAGKDEAGATEFGLSFVKAAFPSVKGILPQ